MKLIVLFLGALALVQAAVIDHNVVDTPSEKTSLFESSEAVDQEENVAVDPTVKSSQPEEAVAEVVPDVKTVVPQEEEVHSVKVETDASVVHQEKNSVDVPVFKTVTHVIPSYQVAPGYQVVPSWYSYPWFRNYYPYYFF